MSSAASVQSVSTADSSEAPGRSGIMFVCLSIRDKSLPEQVLHDWYDEHAGIALNCEGNGRLMLRYLNADPHITAHEDLTNNFASRTNPESPGDEVASAGLRFLCLLKVLDSNWYQSDGFNNMPRNSKILPPLPDGSLGSPFVSFFCALRGYATIEERWTGQPQPRPKYLISVQTSDASAETFDEIDKAYASLPSFRGTGRYETDSEKLGDFAEPGNIPAGLVLYHFDGDAVPDIKPSLNKSVVRQDAWNLFKEIGDKSLTM